MALLVAIGGAIQPHRHRHPYRVLGVGLRVMTDRPAWPRNEEASCGYGGPAGCRGGLVDHLGQGRLVRLASSMALRLT
jgi:hypothetical protein